MTPEITLRSRIQACIDASPVFLTARQIAESTGIPYKATIDALIVLHARDRIVRHGRKFSSTWGSKALVSQQSCSPAWNFLAAAWFGGKISV